MITSRRRAAVSSVATLSEKKVRMSCWRWLHSTATRVINYIPHIYASLLKPNWKRVLNVSLFLFLTLLIGCWKLASSVRRNKYWQLEWPSWLVDIWGFHSSTTAVSRLTVLFLYEDISLTRCVSHGDYVLCGKLLREKCIPGSLRVLSSSVSPYQWKDRVRASSIW